MTKPKLGGPLGTEGPSEGSNWQSSYFRTNGEAFTWRTGTKLVENQFPASYCNLLIILCRVSLSCVVHLLCYFSWAHTKWTSSPLLRPWSVAHFDPTLCSFAPTTWNHTSSACLHIVQLGTHSQSSLICSWIGIMIGQGGRGGGSCCATDPLTECSREHYVHASSAMANCASQ